MLVVDIDALQTIDFLDLVHQVFLQFLFAQHGQDVVRIARTIHQWVARFHPLALLHVDVNAARDGIFFLFPVVSGDGNLTHTLGDFAVLDDAVDLGDDGRLTRFARFEQLHHARQTAGDVLGLGGRTRNLGEHVAGVDHFFVIHHQMRVGGHQIALFFRSCAAFRPHNDGGDALFIRRIRHHPLRHTGDFVHLLLQGDALAEILEMDLAADFREDREGVRIPFQQDRVGCNFGAVGEQDLGAIHYRVALFFATLLVDDGQDAVAVHRDQLALGVFNCRNAQELHVTVRLGVLLGLFARPGSRTAHVEGAHRELGSGFTDGLRGNNSHSFAAFHHAAGGQVASVAELADAALRFAGQHRTNLDAFDTGGLNRGGQVFRDFLVETDDQVAFIVELIFESHAANNAIAQWLDDFARLDDRLYVNAIAGTAIVLCDDHVLRHVAEAAGEITGIGRLQRRIGQSLAGAVCRDEVLQYVETFAEVRCDGGLDDFTRRLGHQAAHTGELADLLLRSAGAGIGHDVNRIQVTASAVVLLHGLEHFLSHAFGDLGPDFDDLVVALTLRNSAFLILLGNFDDGLLGVLYQLGLLFGHHHVVNADGNSRARGVQEAQLLNLVQHRYCDLQAELQIAVLHQLREPLLL